MGWRSIIAAAALAWAGIASAGAAAPCVITWLPGNDVFPRWGQDVLGGAAILPAPSAAGLPADAWAWELAVLGQKGPHGPFLRVPLKVAYKALNGAGYYGMPFALEPAECARLNALGEGPFLAAILLEGERCSNVARIAIRAGYDLRREPVLRVTGLRTPGSAEVNAFGLWVVPPPDGPPVTNFDAACKVKWLVDGTLYSPSGIGWAGPVSPLPAGMATPMFRYLSTLSPPLKPLSHAVVQACLDRWASPPAAVVATPEDDARLDRALAQGAAQGSK